MRFNRLELENFRHHVHTAIDFRDGLTGIVGANGTGKSTVLEAICWCLYGPTAAVSSQADLAYDRMTKGDRTRVRFSFTLGSDWEVVREPGGATVYKDGVSVCEGATACAQYIEKEVFRMSWQEWSNTFFAGQKALDWLKGKGRADRERFLSDTLGHGRLEVAQKLARADSRAEKATVAAYEKELEALPETEKAVADGETGLREQRAVLADATTKAEAARDRQRAAREALREQETAADLHRKLGARLSAAEKDAADARALLSSTRAKMGVLESDLKRVEPLGLEIADLMGKLEAASSEADAHHEKKAALTKELEDANAGMDELTKEVTLARSALLSAEKVVDDFKDVSSASMCPTCHQEIAGKAEGILAMLEAKVTELTPRYEGANTLALNAAKERDGLRERYAAADRETSTRDRAVIDIRNDLKARRSRMEDLKARELEYRQLGTQEGVALRTVEQAEAGVTDLRAQLDASAFDEEKHRALVAAHDAAITEAETLARRASDAQTTLHTLETSQSRHAEKLTHLREVEAKVSTARAHIMEIDATDRMLGSLRQWLNERIRPEISARASAMVSTMSNGRFTALELDEDYKPALWSADRKLPLASGGEWDIANLSLRLATSQMIAESSGHDLDVIVLDEVLGSLDRDRRESVVESLRSAGESRFRQIIMVTHEDAIRDRLDNLIETSLSPEETAVVCTS